MNNDQNEIGKLFANKYASYDQQRNQILQQSIQKVLLKETPNSEKLNQLRNKLISSQSQQQFFPDVIKNTSSRTMEENAINLEQQSNSVFQKRLKPFQKNYLQCSDQQSETSEQQPKSVYFVDRKDEDEWAALMKFDAQLFQKEQERKKQLLIQKKIQMKQELDEQMKLKQEKKQKEKDLDEKYNKFENDLLQNKNQKEIDKQNEMKLKIQSLQSERDYQLEQKKKKKQYEEKQLKIYKNNINNRYEEELKKQIEEENKIKQQKKDYMFKVMKQSQNDKELIKEKLTQLEKMEDENSKKYGELLDQIEIRRLEENRIHKEKIDKNNAFSESQLQKYKLAVIDDQKLKKWQQYEEQKFNEEQKFRQQKIDELKAKTIQSLEQSIKLKEIKKISEKKLDHLQGQLWKEDTERYFKEEQEKYNQIKKIQLNYKKVLLQQMNNKQKKERGDKMSIPELLQNKHLLKEIKNEKIYDVEKTIV